MYISGNKYANAYKTSNYVSHNTKFKKQMFLEYFINDIVL